MLQEHQINRMFTTCNSSGTPTDNQLCKTSATSFKLAQDHEQSLHAWFNNLRCSAKGWN